MALSGISRRLLSSLRSIDIQGLDHVCLVSKDVERSVKWYQRVLGMSLRFNDEDHFWPRCKESPAFMERGGAKVALLPVQQGYRERLGDHFALTVSREEFKRAQRDLGKLIGTEDIEQADYGRQLSLFFKDPDGNVVELTTWVSPSSKDRL
mmetsp:Transcript_6216/g.9801  ORF Transcript_6216/g.9801 Transcript_6216/m.9801 type:complete len:151 (+) Transcript_6216:307-759(+)